MSRPSALYSITLVRIRSSRAVCRRVATGRQARQACRARHATICGRARDGRHSPRLRIPEETMIDPFFDLSGKIALITGGSRGLGLQMVHAFADRGADVIIASRKLDACEAVAE